MCICDTFLAFEETEQSKTFPNAVFGCWKMTVERPVRLKGIDSERVYTAKEITVLKQEAERLETALPVIKRVYKKRTGHDPLRGLFPITVDRKLVGVQYEPDTELCDTEQVPLMEEGGIEAFLRHEVLTYAPDAWHLESKVNIGYEVSFTRYFYKPQPLRPPEEIRTDILAVERETEGLLAEIMRCRV